MVGQGSVMATVNVLLPDALKSFVDRQVASRGRGTSGEYVREPMRGLLLAGADSAPASAADGARLDRLRERVRRKTTA